MGQTNKQLQQEVDRLIKENRSLIEENSFLKKPPISTQDEAEKSANELSEYCNTHNIPVMIFLGSPRKSVRLYRTASVGTAIDMLSSIAKNRPNFSFVLSAANEAKDMTL